MRLPFKNIETLKTALCAKRIVLETNRSKRVQQTIQLCFVEFPYHLTHQEMLLCDSFFAPLKHKYLESSIKKKKTLKTAEPFFEI